MLDIEFDLQLTGVSDCLAWSFKPIVKRVVHDSQSNGASTDTTSFLCVCRVGRPALYEAEQRLSTDNAC